MYNTETNHKYISVKKMKFLLECIPINYILGSSTQGGIEILDETFKYVGYIDLDKETIEFDKVEYNGRW